MDTQLKTARGTVINYHGVSKENKWYYPLSIKKIVQHVNHKLDTYGKSPDKVLCHAVNKCWKQKTGTKIDDIVKACEHVIDTNPDKASEVWGTNRVNSKGKKNSGADDITGHARTMMDWYGIPVFNCKGNLLISEELTEYFYNTVMLDSIKAYMEN
jgi:hypothetical protein